VKPADLKGIVHPKITILSSFTHLQVVPNLYECVCSAEHKRRYSEECGKCILGHQYWKSMVPQNSLVTNFFKELFNLKKIYSIQFKIICKALFTIQSLQSNFTGN